MRTGKQRGGALVFGALLVGLVWGATASVAAAESTPGNQGAMVSRPVAVVTVVRARDLMSAADRQLYRQQIRDARDVPTRQRIHGEWLERLQARAAEHGVIMVVEARTLPPEWRRVQSTRPVGPEAPPPPPPRAP